jgi:hypothetical protein
MLGSPPSHPAMYNKMISNKLNLYQTNYAYFKTFLLLWMELFSKYTEFCNIFYFKKLHSKKKNKKLVS